MERNQLSKGHSQTGDHIRRDRSGHRKKLSKQGALTNWRPHWEGQVRTQKETDQARGAHQLETASGGTSQDREKLTGQGALTSWRPHWEGQVRTQIETNQTRGTHFLETTPGGTSQDTERNRPSKGPHILETALGGTSQDMERNQSGKGHSQTGDRIGRVKSGHGKKPNKQGALTSWRPHQEGQVRTQKETDRAGGTHKLETASGGTSQDVERKG